MSDSFDKLMNDGRPPNPKKPGKKAGMGLGKRLLLTLVIVLCVLTLLTCGAAFWGYSLSTNGRNLPQVYVDGIFVGDMTAEETEAALRAANFDALEDESLTVRLPAGVSFPVGYLRAGAVLSRDEAVRIACAYGHDGGVFQNLWRWLENHIRPVDVAGEERPLDEAYIRSCLDGGVHAVAEKLRGEPWRLDSENARFIMLKGAGGIELDTDGLYDAVCRALRRGETALQYDTLRKALDVPNFEMLYEKICRESANACFNESFEIEPEVVGCSFGVEEAVQLWQAAGVGEQVVIPLTMTQPEVTAERLRALLFRDVLGAQLTYYTGSTAERINNIRLAAAKLDGLILLPGQTFSYNEAVGRRTVEAGFQYADAYSDGQVVPELGGGICQVSSTLYSACLYARMKILTRQNHYFKVGYIDYGMDATVSWGQPDFRFRNDRELPVKLAAYVNEDECSLVVEIWGTDFDGITVRLRHTEEDVFDEELPDVLIGKSIHTYGDLYDAEGNYLSTVNENSGIYYFHDEDIDWPDGYVRGQNDAYLGGYYNPT